MDAGEKESGTPIERFRSFIPYGNVIYRFVPSVTRLKYDTRGHCVSTRATNSVQPSISLLLKSITLASSTRIDKIDRKRDAWNRVPQHLRMCIVCSGFCLRERDLPQVNRS